MPKGRGDDLRPFLSASHTYHQPTRLPSAKKPPQARLGNLFTYPPGNGRFGTPVYSLVYIFAGEAIFQARKKAGKLPIVTYRLYYLSGGEG